VPQSSKCLKPFKLSLAIETKARTAERANLMQTFETTDLKTAQRCRYAQFTGQKKTLSMCGSEVTGMVHSVMEDALSTPKKWVIKIAIAN
jgi:hypothetical protein